MRTGNVALMVTKREALEKALAEAQAEFEAKKHDPATRKDALFRRNQAQAKLHFYEERSHEDLKNIINMIRKWGRLKNGTQLAYLSALHAIATKRAMACQDQKRLGTGSIVFYAFPQQVVNKVVERTGGRPIAVAITELCDGEVEIDPEGRIFLTTPDKSIPHGRQTFLAQVTERGEVFMDRDGNGNPVLVSRVQPFRFGPGKSEVRDGKVTFPGTQQRPYVPERKKIKQEN